MRGAYHMPGDYIYRWRFRRGAAFSRATVLALAASGVLVVIAAPGSTQASSASTEQQALSAEVSSEISWGSAGGCQQNIQTNDFGSLTPAASEPTLGVFAALPTASA